MAPGPALGPVREGGTLQLGSCSPPLSRPSAQTRVGRLLYPGGMETDRQGPGLPSGIQKPPSPGLPEGLSQPQAMPQALTQCARVLGLQDRPAPRASSRRPPAPPRAPPPSPAPGRRRRPALAAAPRGVPPPRPAAGWGRGLPARGAAHLPAPEASLGRARARRRVQAMEPAPEACQEPRGERPRRGQWGGGGEPTPSHPPAPGSDLSSCGGDKAGWGPKLSWSGPTPSPFSPGHSTLVGGIY